MSGPPETLCVSAAGLLLTYWCNARCAHCYVSAGPERSAWMDLEAARGHFAALARLGADPAAVHVGGGEPFGRFELLLEVVRAAREAGLPGVGYVETNGAWATSDSAARDRLAALREAGMRQISISADVFHQTFIDPACVTRLRRAAETVLGPGGIRARRWRFLEAPQDLRSADGDVRREAYRRALLEYGERLTGRAARTLAELLPRRPAASFAGQDCRKGLAQSGHVHVDPYGNVFPGTCVGLVLGRTTGERPLDRVLRGPRGPLWRTLCDGGSHALSELAASHGFRTHAEGYADKCHLCTAVRVFLWQANLFREELGPVEVMEEG